MIRRRPLRIWLLWAVGAAVLVLSSLAVADPAILSLALDPELVALVVASSISIVRGWMPGSQAWSSRSARRSATARRWRCRRPKSAPSEAQSPAPER